MTWGKLEVNTVTESQVNIMESNQNLPDFGLPEDLPQSVESITPDKGSDVSRETKARIRQAISYRQTKALPAVLAEIHALRSLKLSAPKEPQVIAVVNPQTASGKTSTTVNTAVALAEQGVKVLILDLTSESSHLLGANPHVPTIADVLFRRAELSEVAYSLPQYSGDISLVRSDSSLAQAELELLYQPSKETRLREAVQKTKGFDYILIDCPSSYGVLTLNAVLAASSVLVPLGAANQSVAMEAVDSLLNFAAKNFGASVAKRAALILDREDRVRGNNLADVQTGVKGSWNLLKSVIPFSRDIEDAEREGLTAVAVMPESDAMLAYLKLVRELNKIF